MELKDNKKVLPGSRTLNINYKYEHMNEMDKIPLDWFRQIYIKNGKRMKLTDKINSINFKDILENYPYDVFSVLSYCIANMRVYDGDLIKTITIELDYNNPVCRKRINSDKGKFYKAINDCIDHKILYKLKPKVYIVSMDYICLMNKSQKSLFNSSVYSRMNVIDLSNIPTRQPPEYKSHAEQSPGK